MVSDPIDPAEFIAAVQPVLEAQDPAALLVLLKSRWRREQIQSLLSSDNCDARKVAALALALVGTKCCVNSLAAQLKHADPMVNQMAEHALWSIWFRSGTCEANHELCRGTQALNRQQYEQAIEHFTRAIQIEPTFAEAYNQRGIVKYLQERYDDCLEDCRKAAELMPCHFGAWAGMGHCHAHEGRFSDALDCYAKALAINPHLTSIPQVICELKKKLRQQ